MDIEHRIQNMRLSLTALAMGDAFGERFFGPSSTVLALIEERALPSKDVWKWTDDTAMAISIVDVLTEFQTIDQEALANLFATRYVADRLRGYGGGAHRLLEAMALGAPWRAESKGLFGGSGSFGNGGAMRAAPIGAYFCDDYERVAHEARKSAEITHANINGIEGAVAVAIAAAEALKPSPDLIGAALEFLPPCQTRENVEHARNLTLEASVSTAVNALGNGAEVSAQDTVGFTLWCAQRHIDDFEEAMWTTVSGLGDRDTTCAIVGGILGARVGHRQTGGIPESYLSRLEPLDVFIDE
ncbi:MAG: ADP-ribosylglycohydrolase family protein [bacterium]